MFNLCKNYSLQKIISDFSKKNVMNFRKVSIIPHLGISIFLYLLYTVHILCTIFPFSLAVANLITSDVLDNFSSPELDFFWCYIMDY